MYAVIVCFLLLGLSGETEAMVVGVPKHWALIVAGSHMYHNYRHQVSIVSLVRYFNRIMFIIFANRNMLLLSMFSKY